jgi:hypothetical protein
MDGLQKGGRGEPRTEKSVVKEVGLECNLGMDATRNSWRVTRWLYHRCECHANQVQQAITLFAWLIGRS